MPTNFFARIRVRTKRLSDYEQAYFCLCGAYPNGGKPIVQYPQKSGLLVVDELLIPCSQTNSLDLYLLGSWAGGWQTEYFYD